MYILKDPDLVFLAQPRTASQAVAELLSQLGADPHGNHHDVDVHHMIRLQDQGFTSFSTVRNHWDAMVSWWYMYRARRHAATFEAWCNWAPENHPYFRPRQMYWNQPAKAQVILRFEHIDDDLENLIPGYVLPRKNVSDKRKRYQLYYDEKLRDLVGEWFAPEIEEYQYEFEGEPERRTTRQEDRDEILQELAHG